MEPKMGGRRVGRPFRNTASNNISPAPSPTPPRSARNKKQPAKKLKTAEVDLAQNYAVKRILDEEERDGVTHYEIDWENDPKTGKPFPTSWEPHHYVTPDIIETWNKRNQTSSSSRAHTSSASQSEPTASSEESQSLRPAKRRKITSAVREASLEDSPARAPQSNGKEIKDSYEEEEKLSSLGERRALVVIPPKDEDFNPEEYDIVSVQSTQPSPNPTPRQRSEQSSRLADAPSPIRHSSSPIRKSIPRKKNRSCIWDEDIPQSEAIVPDSQEPHASSTYIPSATATSRTDIPSRYTTESNLAVDSEKTDLPSTQWESSKSYQQSSVESSSAAAELCGDAVDSGASQVERSLESSSTSHRSEHIQQRSQSTSSETPAARARELTPFVQTQDEGEASGVLWSKNQLSFDISANSAPHRQRDTWSGGSSHPLPLSQPPESYHPEISQVSSIGFQTQLPPVRDYENSSDQATEDRPGEEATPRRQSPVVVDSQGASATQSQRQLSRLTEPPISSFDAVWQSSRVTSGTPRTTRATRVPLIVSGSSGSQENPIQIASPTEETPPQSSVHAASQSDINTQESSDKAKSLSSGDRRSQLSSSHLPSPPVEDEVISSIEDTRSGIEDIKSSIEDPEDFQPSSQPGSSPFNSPPGAFRSSSMIMEPPTDTPGVTDASAALKKMIADRRAARQASSSRPVSSSMSPAPGPPVILTQQTAATMSVRDASVSMSPAPAAAPPPTVVLNHQALMANQVLPMQTTTEVPVAATESAPLPTAHMSRTPSIEQDSTSLAVLPPEQDAYDVPLPMVSFSRDIYVAYIKKHEQPLRTFLNDVVFEENLIAQVSEMLDDLGMVCDHPDLVEGDTPTQKFDSYDITAKWAETTSTKCIFLVEFLNRLVPYNLHVIVLVRAGRMLEILEALLTFHNIMYTRADRQEWIGPAQASLRVTLYPTDTQQYPVVPPSAVIAFDSTSSAVPNLQGLRTVPQSHRLVPMISLRITNSMEHLERCFDKNLDSVEKKFRLARCITQLMDRVGGLDGEYKGPPDAAVLVAGYLASTVSEWPLLPMPDIDGLDLSLMTSQAGSSYEYTTAGAPASSTYSSNPVLQPGVKRSLDIEERTGTDSPKRQRMTPIPGEGDASHVSETVRPASSAGVATNIRRAESSSPTGTTQGREDVAGLKQKIRDLEAQVREKEETEKDLMEINDDLERQCKDFRSSMDTIGPKYQEALNERGRYEHECTMAEQREAKLQKQLIKKDADISKLRDQESFLESELDTARNSLSNSSNPNVAGFEALRKELAQSKAETALIQKRLTNQSDTLNYAQDAYRLASDAAAESARERDALLAEVTLFREKANANIVAVHQIQTASTESELLARNSQLKARIAEAERELEKKDAELKALSNGRRGTRGTSVPRSPGPAARPIGRAIAGARSRGTSPALGEVAITGWGAATPYTDAFLKSSLNKEFLRDM